MNHFAVYYAGMMAAQPSIDLPVVADINVLVEKKLDGVDMETSTPFRTLFNGNRVIGFASRWGNVFVVDVDRMNTWLLFGPDEIFDVLGLTHRVEGTSIGPETLLVVLGQGSNCANNFGRRLEIVLGDE